MKAILLVTWFYYGQAPASYQTPFENMDACLAARAAIMGDAVRLKVEAEKDVEQKRTMGIISNPIIPTVSAVCSVQ
jgi:hypothetical protein